MLTLPTQYGIIPEEWRKMPYFSKKSLERLDSCAPLLQEIANEAIKYVDFSVIHGHRIKTTQDRLFKEGFSTKKWPSSKHNHWPSRAIDIIPYPIKEDWEEDRDKFFFLAGVFISIAKKKEIPLRWGGAWSGEFNKEDEWDDLAHFELLG